MSRLIWGDRTYKLDVRQHTIIDKYKEIFGRDSLPLQLQYWALCGDCTDSQFKPHQTSEIGQLLDGGFITPQQFYGIDADSNIITNNKQAFPDSNWLHGDMFGVLAEHEDFRPGIINIDSLSGPQKTCPLLASVMEMVEGEVMIVANILMEFMGIDRVTKSQDYLEQELFKSRSFKIALRNGNWEAYPVAYSYYTPNTLTKMTTIILINR